MSFVISQMSNIIMDFSKTIDSTEWIFIQFDFLQSLETEMYTVAIISSDHIITPSIVLYPIIIWQ